MEERFKNLSEYIYRENKDKDWIQKRKRLSTGLFIMDNYTGGLKPGELVVIASRPSIGKTALALSLAVNMAFGSDPVSIGFFSMEMDGQELMKRVMANVGKIDLAELRRESRDDTTASRIAMVTEQLLARSDNILICDDPHLRLSDICYLIRNMVYSHGVKAVFIDYLGMVDSDRSDGAHLSRRERISIISERLKQLARELGITIICLCEVNSCPVENDRAPTIADLKNSGSIEHDADLIILLDDPVFRYRLQHDESSTDREHDGIYQDGNFRRVLIAKNRNGCTGLFSLKFLPEYSRFEERQYP